jgi:hypothetical protein
MKNRQSGVALILALMMLSFLAVLGGALLTSVTLDAQVGNNYRDGLQTFYLAEAGAEQARELLRISNQTPSQLLVAGAGVDGVLSMSTDPDELRNRTDDLPLIPSTLLADVSGREAGRYAVWIRNDGADGMSNVSDANQALTLLSVGVVAKATTVLELTVLKWRFPAVPAALMLDGSPASFNFPVTGDLVVTGLSQEGVSAIGLTSESDRNAVATNADVAITEALMDPRLKRVVSLENIVQTIAANATEVYRPGYGVSAALGNIGGPADYRVVAVEGNCRLGPGTGYGILLVRGDLELTGTFNWNGLVLVIGQGSVVAAPGSSGRIDGAVFLARTHAADRAAANLLGTLLTARGSVTADFRSGGAIAIQWNSGNVVAANRSFPFVPIAIRQF